MLDITEEHSKGTAHRPEALPDLAASHAFVVPAFGCSPFLDACLRSLNRQTLRTRVVVTTSTPSRFIDDIALANKTSVIVNPVCGGIASDWNFALTSTDARYVTLAHQDDLYAADFVARSLAAFDSLQGSLCFTGQEQIDDAGRPCMSRLSLVKRLLARLTIGGRTRPSPRQLRAFLAFGNPLPCSSVTLDRHHLPDFSFSAAYQSNLDWDAWLRLVDQGVVFLSVAAPLVQRRHNDQTATAGLIASGRRKVEDLMMFRRIWPSPIAEAIAAVYRIGYR